MDNATRLQYLEAMGIAVWVPRHQPVAATQVVGEPSENAGWAEQSDAHHEGYTPPEAITEQSATRQDESSEFVEATPGAQSPEQPAPLQLAPSSHHHTDDQAWKDLQNQVASCRACGLCETRTQTVFGVGNKHASWMLIGEAPGQNEDLQGEPFVGRAGQLLTEMLRAIGLTREEVYIANILKCRPPNNRDPQSDEIAACHDFLRRQIALAQPRIILAVGRIAAQNLLKTQQPLAKLRGVRHHLDDIPLIVIPHPAYLLRSLPEKAKAWEDLQFALSVYKALE